MPNNFSKRWRATWNPDMYHGWGRTRNYFEGWYFKIVDPTERFVFALIPGISLGKNGDTHAFIQMLDGKKSTSTYHEFPADNFQPSSETFELALADNFFSANQLHLNLPELQGELHWQNRYPWPRMLGAPGIMGWFSFVPFMECYHGVVSLNHTLQGRMRVYGEDVDFTDGKGYIEKDWGRSFPRAYVWMQSNHFDQTDRASMMASAAHIPWLGSYFVGFISGMWLEDKLFKFATYTGARKFLKIEGESVELVFKNPKTELRILANQAAGTSLISPLSGEMKGKIQESLQATLQVELLENGQRIFEGTGINAGLEVAGKVDVLQ